MLRVTIVGILVLASAALAQPEKPPYLEPNGWSKESIDEPEQGHPGSDPRQSRLRVDVNQATGERKGK